MPTTSTTTSIPTTPTSTAAIITVPGHDSNGKLQDLTV
jgi:hypothetical protein